MSQAGPHNRRIHSLNFKTNSNIERKVLSYETNENVNPEQDGTYDLGKDTLTWRNLRVKKVKLLGNVDATSPFDPDSTGYIEGGLAVSQSIYCTAIYADNLESITGLTFDYPLRSTGDPPVLELLFDEATIQMDAGTHELYIPLDGTSLIYDAGSSKVKVNIDGATLVYDTGSAKLKVDVDNVLDLITFTAPLHRTGITTLGVQYDANTIQLNDDDELEVPIDGTTLVMSAPGGLLEVAHPACGGNQWAIPFFTAANVMGTDTNNYFNYYTTTGISTRVVPSLEVSSILLRGGNSASDSTMRSVIDCSYIDPNPFYLLNNSPITIKVNKEVGEEIPVESNVITIQAGEYIESGGGGLPTNTGKVEIKAGSNIELTCIGDMALTNYVGDFSASIVLGEYSTVVGAGSMTQEVILGDLTIATGLASLYWAAYNALKLRNTSIYLQSAHNIHLAIYYNSAVRGPQPSSGTATTYVKYTTGVKLEQFANDLFNSCVLFIDPTYHYIQCAPEFKYVPNTETSQNQLVVEELKVTDSVVLEEADNATGEPLAFFDATGKIKASRTMSFTEESSEGAGDANVELPIAVGPQGPGIVLNNMNYSASDAPRVFLTQLTCGYSRDAALSHRNPAPVESYVGDEDAVELPGGFMEEGKMGARSLGPYYIWFSFNLDTAHSPLVIINDPDSTTKSLLSIKSEGTGRIAYYDADSLTTGSAAFTYTVGTSTLRVVTAAITNLGVTGTCEITSPTLIHIGSTTGVLAPMATNILAGATATAICGIIEAAEVAESVLTLGVINGFVNIVGSTSVNIGAGAAGAILAGVGLVPYSVNIAALSALSLYAAGACTLTAIGTCTLTASTIFLTSAQTKVSASSASPFVVETAGAYANIINVACTSTGQETGIQFESGGTRRAKIYKDTGDGLVIEMASGTTALSASTGGNVTCAHDLTVSGSTYVSAATATGLITGSAGLTISAGSTSLQATTTTTMGCTTLTASGLITAQAGITVTTGQTVNVGTSGTTSPLNVYGLITGAGGLTISSGASAVQDLTVNGTLTYTGTLALGSISCTGSATFCSSSGTCTIGTGTSGDLTVNGNVIIGATGNTTNRKQVLTVYGYNTNKNTSSMYNNTVIQLIQNYGTSISDSTPSMQALSFTSNTRTAGANVTWSSVAGYAASLTSGSENCGLLFATTASGTLTQRMRLDYNGCLMIGNTTSSGILNVGSSTALNVSSAGLLTVANATDVSGTSASITTSGGIYAALKLQCATAATLCSTSGTCTIGATTALTVSTAGLLQVANTQDYDNTSGITASILTAGGIYAAKRIYNETGVNLCATSGTCTIGSTTAAIFSAAGVLTIANATDVSGSSASITTSGGIYAAKQLQCLTAATLCSSSGTCTIGATNAVTITTAGKLTVPSTASKSVMHGAVYPGSSGYTSSVNIDTSQQMICGSYTYASTDHAAQLVLLDNSSTAGSGGNCGALVFAGPAKNFGSSLYMAAGRIRAANGSGSYYGTMYLETLTTGGALTTAITINNDQSTTFAAGVTVTTGATVNVGTSGTTSPLNVYGDFTVGASANSTNAKNVITSHGYFTNKSPAASYSNGSIVLVNNYTTSLSASTPAMQGIMFTSNTRPSQVTWSTIMGYASSLTASSENCGVLFCTTNSGTLAERMRLDNTGCLSIGNTTASGMLNVGSSTALNVSSAGRLTVANTQDYDNSSGIIASVLTGGGIYATKQIYNETAATLCATSGTCTIGSSTAATISAAGVLTVNSVTDSSSSTTGAAIVKGGLGVAKAIFQASAKLSVLGYLGLSIVEYTITAALDMTLNTGNVFPFGVLLRQSSGANRSDTLPDASAFVTAYGRGFAFLVHNQMTTYTWTINPGSGTTMYRNGNTASVANKIVSSGQMAIIWYNADFSVCYVNG